ncbi:MAG: 2-oxo acid dehydrogenase subunit E2 [Anaerolineae bacterium]|nr:2-oxo acid dehydrogenase subunit E2 [Anaerolineae bacterium]
MWNRWLSDSGRDVRRRGSHEIPEYLSLSVSFDYDLVDGAPAARFVQRLKELVESGYGIEQAAEERG